MRSALGSLAIMAGTLLLCEASSGAHAQDCAGLKNLKIDQTKIEGAESVPAGSTITMPMGMPGMAIGPLPAFCKVTGVIRERTGGTEGATAFASSFAYPHPEYGTGNSTSRAEAAWTARFRPQLE